MVNKTTVFILLLATVIIAVVLWWSRNIDIPEVVKQDEKVEKENENPKPIDSPPEEQLVVKPDPSFDEFVLVYKNLRDQRITQEHIHTFVTTFRRCHKKWGVDIKQMETIIRNVIEDWGFLAKLQLKMATLLYSRNHPHLLEHLEN